MKPVKGKHRILFDVSLDLLPALDAAARIREISRSRLVSRLIETIARDGVFAAVLDDDSRPTPRAPGERKLRRISGTSPVTQANTPVGASRPSFGSMPFVKRQPAHLQPTKGELREQLTQALVNTGGERIES